MKQDEYGKIFIGNVEGNYLKIVYKLYSIQMHLIKDIRAGKMPVISFTRLRRVDALQHVFRSVFDLNGPPKCVYLKNLFLCVLFFSNSSLVSQLFINNEWHESCSGRKIPVYDPATGKLLCEVEEADPVSILYITNKADELLPLH